MLILRFLSWYTHDWTFVSTTLISMTLSKADIHTSNLVYIVCNFFFFPISAWCHKQSIILNFKENGLRKTSVIISIIIIIFQTTSGLNKFPLAISPFTNYMYFIHFHSQHHLLYHLSLFPVSLLSCTINFFTILMPLTSLYYVWSFYLNDFSMAASLLLVLAVTIAHAPIELLQAANTKARDTSADLSVCNKGQCATIK